MTPVAPTEYQMLANYSAELGLENVMSTAMLIDSHRNMRTSLKSLLDDRKNAWAEAKEHAYQIGKDQLSSAYILTSDLEDMTIAQLAEKLGYCY